MSIHFYVLIDIVTPGSENNSLYLYYKGLSKTLLTFKFDTVKSVLDKDKKEDDTNEFVSAVCWRALPDGVRFPGSSSFLLTFACVFFFFLPPSKCVTADDGKLNWSHFIS